VFTPGYYKTNYRALRFRELVRMRGLRNAFRDFVITRFKRPDVGGWMPTLWVDTECKREDLSEQFWQATKPHRLDFERLGFTECGFLKSTKSLNPNVRDSGGITYLDSTRRHFGQLLFNKIFVPSTSTEVNNIVIAITAVFNEGSLSCTNHKKAFDPPSQNKVIRLASYDVMFIHEQFLHHLTQRSETPRQFPDQESLRKWFDARQVEAFEERARRRLFIAMTDQEVVAAKTQIQRAASGGTPPPLPRPQFKMGIWLLIIVAILALEFYRNHLFEKNSDTLDYRGEHFKMRKAYSTYEDYKDDPDNLDTNELDRIEQVMISAKIPSSFKNREEFTHTLIYDLKFPGYGMGGIGEQPQTDDGSTLDVESVEIPQRGKDRFIVVREFQGHLNLLDDFVFGTATNVIKHVKLEKQKLFYYDTQGNLVREKQL
jgi:hypothetical protein